MWSTNKCTVARLICIARGPLSCSWYSCWHLNMFASNGLTITLIIYSFQNRLLRALMTLKGLIVLALVVMLFTSLSSTTLIWLGLCDNNTPAVLSLSHCVIYVLLLTAHTLFLIQSILCFPLKKPFIFFPSKISHSGIRTFVFEFMSLEWNEVRSKLNNATWLLIQTEISYKWVLQ